MRPKSDGDKYIINVSCKPISRCIIQGLCDHEIGTHLLRMINDEQQEWHGNRERHLLLNSQVTEEGLATLNEKLSGGISSSKLLYRPALLYWSVCRAAQVGFAELFHEMGEYLIDPVERFKQCCRIKRGMTKTSLPGASQFPSTYFKGAVELLKHFAAKDMESHKIHDIVSCLYCGRIALQDLNKLGNIFKKSGIRLPRFLDSHDKVEAYKEHCKAILQENEIVATGFKSSLGAGGSSAAQSSSAPYSMARSSSEPSLGVDRYSSRLPVVALTRGVVHVHHRDRLPPLPPPVGKDVPDGQAATAVSSKVMAAVSNLDVLQEELRSSSEPQSMARSSSESSLGVGGYRCRLPVVASTIKMSSLAPRNATGRHQRSRSYTPQDRLPPFAAVGQKVPDGQTATATSSNIMAAVSNLDTLQENLLSKLGKNRDPRPPRMPPT